MRRKMRMGNLTAFVLFLPLAAVAYADEAPSASVAAEAAAAESQVTAQEKVYRLSLDEATKLALANNFDIQIARYDAWIAGTDQGAAESIYDTILTAEIEYSNDQKKQTSTLAGSKTLDNDYNLGLSKKMPMGTTLGVDLDNNRHRTNSSVSTSPLTHDSTLGMTVEQDIGKNFFGIQDRGHVKVTRLDIENARYTSLDKIEESICAAQKAYWDLVLQKEKVTVQQEMAAQAKRLYDLHQEKLSKGLVEAPETIASEANYEKRKNALMLARDQLEAKANTLKLLLNISETDAAIEVTEEFRLQASAGDPAASLRGAFENRRDYQKALNDIKSNDLQLAMSRNSLWPEIDLTATLERNGIGDHFKQSIRGITDEDHPNFFAGLEITFALENTQARSSVKKAELKKTQSLVYLKSLERKIAVEIVDQVRGCNVLREAARSSETIARLHQQKLIEEEKRFSHGRSDTDTMIRFQEDLSRAQEEAADAQYQYHAAVIDLSRREGTLLKRYWEGPL